MKDNIKNTVIILLALLTGIFLVISFSSYNNFRKQKLSRDKEMAVRLDLEEKLNKVAQSKSSTEQELKNIFKNLEEEKIAHEAAKKTLSEQESVIQNLKEELAAALKLKEKLEAGLKEAAVVNKTTVDLAK